MVRDLLAVGVAVVERLATVHTLILNMNMVASEDTLRRGKRTLDVLHVQADGSDRIVAIPYLHAAGFWPPM